MKRPKVAADFEDTPVEAVSIPVTGSTIVLFNATHQPIQCSTVKGDTVITFEPKTRVSLDAGELSEDMKRLIRLGSLLEEHPVME